MQAHRAQAEDTPANNLPDLGRSSERPGTFSANPNPNGVTLDSTFDGKRLVIRPEYSDQTNLSLGGVFAFPLGDSAAAGLVFTAGARKKELLFNAGFQMDDAQRLVLTLGQQRQYLDIGFVTGSENTEMTQNSGAVSYQRYLGKGMLNSFEINGYLADTPSRDLADKTYALDSATLYELWNDPRRVAGGRVTGLQGRLAFTPLPGGTLKLGAGGERLEYGYLTGKQSTTRTTGSAEWSQQLEAGLNLKAGADSGAAQNRYTLGMERPFGDGWLFGVNLVGIRGRDGVPDDKQFKLTWSYDFGGKRATSGSGNSAAPAWGSLLDQVAQRPASLPSQVVAKLDTTAAPVRLISVNKTALPAGASVNPATGAVTAPLGVAITGITGITLNGAPFANSDQFALTGNNLVIDPNKITQPAVGVIDTYVVTMDNSGGGSTLATVKVSHGSVKIDSITIASGDTTAPATTVAPAVSGTTDTATTLTATLNEAGTGYYLVQAAAAAAPSAATVIAANHSFVMAANTPASANITGLTAATAYKIYFVARDAANNVQAAVQSVNVTTTAIPAPAVTADDTGNLIVLGAGAVAANLEVSLDGGAYAAYSATAIYAGNHSVKVRVKAMNGNPAGADTTLSFTEVTPAAPAVTADDTNNKIVLGTGAVAANLEVSIDGGAYAAYNAATAYAGNHSVKVRVKAMNGNPAGADTTLSFTEAAPAGPAVSADDTGNVIVLGAGAVAANLEVSLDGGAYAAYSAATTYAGNHSVKVRTKAMNGNPAGADTTLSFTEVAPAAPNVSANDDSDVIVLGSGVSGANLEVSLDGGAYAAYNASTGYGGDHTVRVRVKAMNGNPAGADTTLSFTEPPPPPNSAPTMSSFASALPLEIQQKQ